MDAAVRLSAGSGASQHITPHDPFDQVSGEPGALPQNEAHQPHQRPGGAQVVLKPGHDGLDAVARFAEGGSARAGVPSVHPMAQTMQARRLPGIAGRTGRALGWDVQTTMLHCPTRMCARPTRAEAIPAQLVQLGQPREQPGVVRQLAHDGVRRAQPLSPRVRRQRAPASDVCLGARLWQWRTDIVWLPHPKHPSSAMHMHCVCGPTSDGRTTVLQRLWLPHAKAPIIIVCGTPAHSISAMATPRHTRAASRSGTVGRELEADVAGHCLIGRQWWEPMHAVHQRRRPWIFFSTSPMRATPSGTFAHSLPLLLARPVCTNTGHKTHAIHSGVI